MKRVLVISYYWPPSGGSGVQRWVKMCKYLPSFGWQPVVYTPENPAVTSKDASLADDIPADVEVLRRPILEPGQFASRTTSAQVTPINAQKKTFKQKLMMWVRGNMFIPDPRVLWVRPSVRFLKEYVKGHPVDAIVSTGPPHSMHLIARRLSASTGLPWIADFRDPWTRMFYFKHLNLNAFSRRCHEKTEKAVLDDASLVVAVSPLVQQDFKAMTATKVELVTNGYDKDDFAGSVARSEEFTIVHAGLFAADGNPVEFWEVLSELCASDTAFRQHLRIQLCGKTDAAVLDSIKAAGLQDCTIDRGYVGHAEAVEAMRSAQVLLLPLRREPEYKATLPGKLFEYLASRRPVVGIGQPDGAMAAILSSSGAGECFEWNQKEQMKVYVKKLYSAYLSGKLEDNPANLEMYSRDALAERYAALLDSLTNNG